MQKSPNIHIRSSITPAWNASCALPPARLVRSAQTVSSISPRATPTITASSWADSTTGWRRSRDSKSAHDYRKNVSGAETVSMWQSLSFGANYKAAYCMAVCPAGEDVIAPFLTDRKQFLDDVVRPLQNKPETVYVVPKSDAEEFVARRFPHKKSKRVSNGLAGQGSIRAFLRGLNFVFQKGQSKGLNAIYHFTFTGQDEVNATVTIRDEKLRVSEGHNGQADLRLTADTETWLRFMRKEDNLV